MDVVEALNDQNLLGVDRNPEEWRTWDVVLKATYGLPLDPEELEVFEGVAGGRAPPEGPVRELVGVIGRRGGKTRAASALLAWSAVSRNWHTVCAPGEVATHLFLASNKEQATVALNYCKAMFEVSPVMRQHVVKETQFGMELDTGAEVVILASNFRSIRGRSIPVAVLDETAFWNDGITADLPGEVYAALRPSMATFEHPLLVLISSAYKKSGLFFERFDAGWGRDDPDQLVVKGTTEQFNPTISREFIAKELARDEVKNRAEYLSEWRTDIERFISLDALHEAVIPHRRQLAPSLAIRYRAFVDVSGGASDSLAMCIAHYEGSPRRTICDYLHERKAPFDPEDAVQEACEILRTYRIRSVTGDAYSAGWASGSFARRGVNYHRSELPKSQLYENLLPSIMSKRIELLDHDASINQIYRLERRTTRAGRDSIDHERGAKDDIANCIAGVCLDNRGRSTRTVIRAGVFGQDGVVYDSEDPDDVRRDRERQQAILEVGAENVPMRTVYEGIPNPDLFGKT